MREPLASAGPLHVHAALYTEHTILPDSISALSKLRQAAPLHALAAEADHAHSQSNLRNPYAY